MILDRLGADAKKMVEEVLGYLNFSSGTEDPRFLGGMNRLFEQVSSMAEEAMAEKAAPTLPVWKRLRDVVRCGLDELRRSSPTFAQADQAKAVIPLVFDHVLPGYREYHADLLKHQTDEALYTPFAVGRACEAVLVEGGPWDQTDRIVVGAIGRICDFIGYRPVAVLRNQRKLQPYAHEWVQPIPLYIDGAGAAVGQYHDLVDAALDILRQTDAAILRQAGFDPALLTELALDPRAYDFDHPANRRPNHHFGSWDPHKIDNKGYYRRFVVHQVTLDSLLERVDSREGLPRAELMSEAAAVLAGTMLMGSGVTGNGPEAYDSSVTLAVLMPVIASYRDAFYEELISRFSGAHARRLKVEAKALHQPFGGARQDLNQKLARRRAEQLQRVHLARLFAQMGYTDAAARQAGHVPVASARMRCEIDCRLSTAHLNIDRGNLAEAAALLPEIDRLIHRAIECGALVDPWNILGFGGQFSLFPAIENSIVDHRIDELIDLMEDLFGLYSRLRKEAAAGGHAQLEEELSAGMTAIAQWWDQFASTEVGGVAGFSAREACESAEQVATALTAWQQSAAAAGDIGFWRQHVERFESPKAFAMLAESLMDNRDAVASMALLSYWLSRADELPLAESEYSFHDMAVHWMENVWFDAAGESDERGGPPDVERCWSLSRKFLDHIEANADEYWHVPELELLGSAGTDGGAEQETGDDEDGLFSAAYEGVTYRDTTDDGLEGETIEWGVDETNLELAVEAERISDRLAVLVTVARLWRLAAEASAGTGVQADDRAEALASWLATALENRRRLTGLLTAVHRYRIAEPRGTQESLIEYTRHQGIKETLLDRIVDTCVEMGETARYLLVATGGDPAAAELEPWEVLAERVLQAALEEDVDAVVEAWPRLLKLLGRQPLLYVPTVRGGNPLRVAASRSLVRILGRLLSYAPRLGLLTETYRLLATIQQMERDHPSGPGSVTEFDHLFDYGCKGLVQCVVSSSQGWSRRKTSKKSSPAAQAELMQCLQKMVERLMLLWLNHSRNIRISVMESVADVRHWRALTAFIERYGGDIFTQQFMNYGNLRAILHQGVGVYLDWLCEQPEASDEVRLAAELEHAVSRDEAESHLTLILEAIVENYSEYLDYNSTTTQSDRGELLYTLLDFLRLEASYDRVAWNLKPVVIAHQVLVQNGQDEAAATWREAVAGRTGGVADDHLDRLDRLVRKYGMRLPSVADRLGERFVAPLAVDRLCALVVPAMEELRVELADETTKPGKTKPKKGATGTASKSAKAADHVSFRLLEQLVGNFTAEPSGVGFEMPAWLDALRNEVERVRFTEFEDEEPPEPLFALPQTCLDRREIEQQIESWAIG